MNLLFSVFIIIIFICIKMASAVAMMIGSAVMNALAF